MNKFLVINPYGIGDVLFTTPVVRALKEKHPDTFIGYWCNERVASLLKSNPDISKVFALSRGDIKRAYKGFKGFIALYNLIKEIRRERFDMAFDFSLDSRYGFWSRLAGIRRRVGFDYRGRGRFLTGKISLAGYSDKHVVEYYLDLLKFVEPFCRVRLSAPYSLECAEESCIKAKKVLAEHGIMPSDLIIGMAPGGGASWGRDAVYKQWPVGNFARLAERLVKESGAHIILLGSGDEKYLADYIVNNARSRRGLNPACFSNLIADLTGKLSLEELAALIKELRILICNDGGPLHMAVALGVKTVSMFGPVDEKVYGPYPSGPDHIVIKKDLACRPCYENFRFKGCANKRHCLEDVTVDEVYEKVCISLSLRPHTQQAGCGVAMTLSKDLP